jgi:hypothetical protein
MSFFYGEMATKSGQTITDLSSNSNLSVINSQMKSITDALRNTTVSGNTNSNNPIAYISTGLSLLKFVMLNLINNLVMMFDVITLYLGIPTWVYQAIITIIVILIVFKIISLFLNMTV